MSCSGSHLGITINIKNTKFVKDLPMIDAQFRFNQCNSFREEYISVFSYGTLSIFCISRVMGLYSSFVFPELWYFIYFCLSRVMGLD
jgi:hypothetical protein